MSRAGAAIHPKLSFVVHGSDHNVDAAVTVEVAERAAAMARRGGGHKACFIGQRLPFAARPEISEDGVWLPDNGSRRARRGHVASGHEQILPAIVIEIVERGPKS